MTQPNKLNNFLPIIDSWEDYFENPHEGLGTLYERFILHRMFDQINKNLNIGSVLEIPGFGMTGVSGVNSLWWAKNGARVRVADWHPERLEHIKTTWGNLDLPVETVLWENGQPVPALENEFDLVWNFASFWFIRNPDFFAGELRRSAKKAILICVPNYHGLGFLLRRKYAKGIEDIFLDNIRPDFIKSVFGREGWQLTDSGIFDVPPWPDIAMKKEDLFKKLHIGFLLPLFNGNSGEDDAQQPNLTILNYFSGKSPDLDKEILKHDRFERTAGWFPSIWGHHRYFLFSRVQH